ncbi:MAG: hypothetical protein M1817_006494 [Caeruleum heppii]|nr:MAG: hypothetical protein M1817_006494 [Caeruleum heppii]
MPRAEVGSTKHLNNKLKSKGLQRLRWYCQVCERQMRDENGFKCHTQSESHVRQMLLVGEDPRKAINEFSAQFQRDFLQLLRTSHGEKKVFINHFYQEYIANKEHVHMNATKWPSLTEFAKFLGREGICRIEDSDKGLQVAWIDNSPEALRRQDAIRKKERQDKGDEEREQRSIRDQVDRANVDAEAKLKEADGDPTMRELHRGDGVRVKLNFGNKAISTKRPSPSPSPATDRSAILDGHSIVKLDEESIPKEIKSDASSQETPAREAKTKVSCKAGIDRPKNVFAGVTKKNLLMSKKPASSKSQLERPISAAERIMKEEIERNRLREGKSSHDRGFKRQKVV